MDMGIVGFYSKFPMAFAVITRKGHRNFISCLLAGREAHAVESGSCRIR